MTENEQHDEGQVNGFHWPPSPRTQIILIALGFGLLNVILLAVWVIALIASR